MSFESITIGPNEHHRVHLDFGGSSRAPPANAPPAVYRNTTAGQCNRAALLNMRDENYGAQGRVAINSNTIDMSNPKGSPCVAEEGAAKSKHLRGSQFQWLTIVSSGQRRRYRPFHLGFRQQYSHLPAVRTFPSIEDHRQNRQASRIYLAWTEGRIPWHLDFSTSLTGGERHPPDYSTPRRRRTYRCPAERFRNQPQASHRRRDPLHATQRFRDSPRARPGSQHCHLYRSCKPR